MLVKAVRMFFIILGCIVGIAAVIVLVAGAIIMLTGISVFGYKYIDYKGTADVYKMPSSASIHAIEVNTNRMSVNFLPSLSSGPYPNDLVVELQKDMSGFVPVDNCALSCDPEISGSTIVITVTEPDGLIWSGGGVVTIYVPPSMNISSIKAVTGSGGVMSSLTAAGATADITTNSWNGGGAVALPNTYSNYIIKTGGSPLNISMGSSTNLNANITFASNSGSLSMPNIILNGNLTVNSSSDIGGPKVAFSALYGNLTVNAKTAVLDIPIIGSGGSSIKINGTSVQLNATTVNGNITGGSYIPAGKTPDANNNCQYNITNLNTTGSTITGGSNNITIKNLAGPLTVTATIGQTSIGTNGKINAKGLLNLTSTSGKITVNYDPNDPATNNDLKITTKEAYIYVTNVKGKVDITAGGGRDRDINISFAAVTNGSKIDAQGYRVFMQSKTGLPYKLLASAEVNMDNGLLGVSKQIDPNNSADKDYVQSTNTTYQYRICYTNVSGTGNGTVLSVITTGQISLKGYNPNAA